MLLWRGHRDECVRCYCLFLHHTLDGISGCKPQFTALNVECVYCRQSPRRSGPTVICLCSTLMSCYISEQKWMQLIDCDAAINYSCNRSVMESSLRTDRHRWMFKGCQHSCVFFFHSGNAFIPTITFPFRLLHVHTLPPTYLMSPHSLLSFCPWTDAFILLRHQSEQIKAPSCPFFLRMAVAAEQIGWCLFLSRVMGIKCDISPQATALLVCLCMKLRYWLAKLSFIGKLLSFRR